MPRRCTVCALSAAERSTIEGALASGHSYRVAGDKAGVSAAAAFRHARKHARIVKEETQLPQPPPARPTPPVPPTRYCPDPFDIMYVQARLFLMRFRGF